MALSIYHSLHLEAKERNEGEAFKTEMLRWKTIAEGVFASQDRLGWARSRLERVVESGLRRLHTVSGTQSEEGGSSAGQLRGTSEAG